MLTKEQIKASSGYFKKMVDIGRLKEPPLTYSSIARQVRVSRSLIQLIAAGKTPISLSLVFDLHSRLGWNKKKLYPVKGLWGDGK